MDAVREHEIHLVGYALDTLASEVEDIALYGPMDPALRGGVVPFNLPGIHPHDVAQVLDRFGIAVRAGHHCTMPLHERLDLAATARASFNVYSTTDDVDALVAASRKSSASSTADRRSRLTAPPWAEPPEDRMNAGDPASINVGMDLRRLA